MITKNPWVKYPALLAYFACLTVCGLMLYLEDGTHLAMSFFTGLIVASFALAHFVVLAVFIGCKARDWSAGNE